VTLEAFLERTFDEALTPADVVGGGREAQWCFDLHRVRWIGSFLALDALCHYAIADDAAPLERALGELRAADAKQRLAYTLTRAALLDVERNRPRDAITRASEALGYAEALDRATEIVLAHAALARARQAVADTAGYARHMAALKSFEQTPVAHWARERARAVAAQETR
jgi:hypothetical protein